MEMPFMHPHLKVGLALGVGDHTIARPEDTHAFINPFGVYPL